MEAISRKVGKRIDVYYYPPSGVPKLRSKNDVVKYCKKQKISYPSDLFLTIQRDIKIKAKVENSNYVMNEDAAKVTGVKSLTEPQMKIKGNVLKTKHESKLILNAPPKLRVCAYINHDCTCGPYLNARRVANLPVKYGPGSLNRVLREAVQTFIDCSENEKNIFSLLKKGEGKVIITANFDDKMHTCRLPPVDNVDTFWHYLEGLFEDLMCCENFYTSQPLEGGCTKCANKGPFRRKSEDNMTVSAEVPRLEKRRWSSDSGETLPVIKPTKQQRSSSQSSESNDYTKLHIRVERSISKPNEWSIDDVIHFICNTDQNMSAYADVFRKHEIDGKALLLLNSEMMMKYMGVKLGPALKICNLIEKLKNKRHH